MMTDDDFRQDDDEDDRPLTTEQRQLVVEHMYLLEEQAKYLRRSFPSTSFDELVSFGAEGLVRAARRFDPARGVDFDKYARSRVRGNIYDEVRRTSRYSERQQEVRKDVRRAQKELDERLARQKNLTETVEQLIAFVAKNPVPQYVDLASAAGVPGSDPSPETAANLARVRDHIRKAAEDLETKERAIVSRVYFHNETLDKAAQHLGITSSWAQRLRARALKALKAALGRKDT